MGEGCDALTEKEKETLRLMVRGHDAKSMANALSLSVHTINERLRAARRKLDVTSSREAARLLFESEAGSHEKSVDENLGDAHDGQASHNPPIVKRAPKMALLIGAIIMSLIAAALLLSTPLAIDQAGSADTAITARDAEVEAAARGWLELGDAGEWQAGFDAAGQAFREANTVEGWTEASRQVRVPLGAVVSRNLATIRFMNAPPKGFQEVTFHTRFANRADAVETVTLVEENGTWKVVGVLID
ncbi:DUF4019 domain-containing protein [Qipengyuania sp. 1NDH17]|uniref:DUF4019 domain-containing protein n=1 Tax=Qipengyuania polymorpha TaxID=2867234 RepID=A0ABS7IYG9_9SPHN|nr:DUF4019 domain-containing protein [Qipengyuania polymorpha]MBX7458597.1 DUF4019 domain-containing protein [Qipengyuania polymorpha]